MRVSMDHFDPWSTAPRLGAEYRVGEATSKRDEQFALDALPTCSAPGRRDRTAPPHGTGRGQFSGRAGGEPVCQLEWRGTRICSDTTSRAIEACAAGSGARLPTSPE